MTRKLLLLIVSLFGIIGLNSCSIDHTDTYSFTNQVVFRFTDKDAQDAIVNYIEATIPHKDLDPYTGNQNDALRYGIKAFEENLKALDFDLLESLLPNEGDAAQYSMSIRGSKYSDYIGYYGWEKKSEKSQ